ncbi:TIGR03089 family protein [Sanguibacter inulinus]|uniref:TIGR03089 family protein n=1 Tax=Sanguibacter inulinus TaxID=60922 RepID=A0A853EXA8_9MICO|nr:TIGR03089 family protein [Sanguibacter inulinus]MBF0723309.1 TIGR03089 family protein [Sanguibacter inulinus]NYS94454.1 TIGR03089 family protein [Sanguibacter inulinus]
MPHTLPSLLGALTTEPGRPRLTWYGDGGERIELSGAVLVNWVSKTTNLLVEEFDAEPGTVVVTDLPPHWRTLVWALATWRAGAHLRVVDDSSDPAADLSGADVVVTATPDRWTTPDGTRPRGTELVAVALPALARSFGADLPPGTVDAASAVMTYGDQVGYVAPLDPDETALSSARGDVAFAALLDWSRSQVDPVAPGDRTLVAVPAGPGAVVSLLATALDLWAADGSLVLVQPDDDGTLPPGRLARLVETERVTAQR